MVGKMLTGMLGALSHDLAVDLGSANTRLAVPRRGVVCKEPSVVALRYRGDERSLVAVGEPAHDMVGRTPRDMDAIYPMRAGVITDFELAEALLRRLMRLATGAYPVVSPRVVLCVPYTMSDVEQRALREAAEAAGARQVHLLDGTLAAALGAGLPVMRPRGSMVVDLGAGTTRVAVLSMGRVVHARTVEQGGDALDRLVARAVAEELGVRVGPVSAEQLKRELGAAITPRRDADRQLAVRGRCVDTGLPRAATVPAALVRQALAPQLAGIVAALRAALEHTPTELAADIADRGVVLTGGAARLSGLDAWLRRETGLAVVTADAPSDVAVLGACGALAEPELLS